MKIIIDGTSEEIAALVLAVQERQKELVDETSNETTEERRYL